MIENREKIISLIRQNTTHPMKLKELAKALKINNRDYPAFRNMVKELIEEGKLVKLKRGRIGLASEMDIIIGYIAMTKSGLGFLLMENEPDILIPHAKLNTAMDGDKVMVRLTGFSGGRTTGAVVKIIERPKRNIVGIFKVEGTYHWVVPDNKKLHRNLFIPDEHSKNAKDGQKVVAVLTAWEDPYMTPEGKVVEVLGYPTQAGVDLQSIIHSYNFAQAFPVEVLDEAERASAMITDEEMAKREDFTKDCVYTIDPFDAKDHDDAVSVERIQNGYRLGVHIADVSYFIDEGSTLDKEALERGTSVYLPGMVIPMLPEILSNDVCSLKPNRIRLAHSVIIDIDKTGKMIKWRVTDALIKSKAKLSYEEVQEFFDSGKTNKKIERVAENLKTARELAKLLNKARFKNGSLDFDLPEAMLILNKQGEVLELGSKVRLEAHRLVEEFMLLANQAVALEMFRKAQPFIYRVHDKPDMDKLNEFSAMMKKLGYKFAVSDKIKPVQIARFLNEVKDKPESDYINELLLRAMQKAVYQRENIGHFGLAFKHYTHFTSPIRRYPDLLVHRLLRKLVRGRYPVKFAKKAPVIIDRASKHCSERERIAESAERDAIKVKQMSFMAKQVGSEYEGVISGVMSFGFFVRLDKLGVEGLVRMSTIDDDYYHYDEKMYRIIGSRNRKVYQLGNRVKVGVLKVDKIRSEMDLYVVPEKKKDSKKRSKKNRNKKKQFNNKKNK